jgi:hypothetical protein
MKDEALLTNGKDRQAINCARTAKSQGWPKMDRYITAAFAALIAFACGAPQLALTPGPARPGWGMTEAAAQTAPANTITITNKSGGVITNYPLQFGRPFIAGAIADQPQVVINGAPILTQADVKNRYPDGSVKFAVIAVMIPTLPATGSLTLTFRNQTATNNTPLTQAQMLDPRYAFNAQIVLKNATTGTMLAASARTMLQNGDYKLWTSGPVAQTIILADDSTSRKYDLGFDGYRPFRPRFFATFWPATHQVLVRYVGENGNTQEIEDLSYDLTLIVGNVKGYAKPAVTHWVLTNWTKSFWLGGLAPPEQVNIDNNLAYLSSTRFIPNYDPSRALDEATIAKYYAAWWTNAAHDIYDGYWDHGVWDNHMGDVGGRPDLGPYPAWTLLWPYTGDWRMQKVTLTMADLAAAFPANLREGATGKRLSRYDPPGNSGLGHTISATDRQLLTAATAWLLFQSTQPPVSDRINVVGPVSATQSGVLWTFDGAHQPAPFYIPYLLTGDPFYLMEMYNWAGFTAMRTGCFGHGGRAPTPSCAGGGISDEVRGQGWVIRSRAETAFIAPDADPEKAFFTYLTNDALARWIGSIAYSAQIDPSPYETAPPVPGAAMNMWQYGKAQGNYNTTATNSWAHSYTVGPIHAIGLDCDPGRGSDCGGFVATRGTPASPWTADTGSGAAPWMQNYMFYGVARAAELGFAAGPLKKWMAGFITGQIVESGNPQIIAIYGMPYTSASTLDWLQSWSDVLAHIQPGYLDGSNTTVYTGGLPAYFASQLNSGTYVAPATVAAAFAADETNGAAAWAWAQTNTYPFIARGDYGIDPRWSILPRTDANILPAIPVQ